MKKLLWVGRLLCGMILVGIVLAGCTTSKSTVGTSDCPAWSRSATTAKCKIMLWKTEINSFVNIDLGEWDQLRITTLSGEVIIDDAINIQVEKENGETVDFSTVRMPPGTYIISRKNRSGPSHFRLISPRNDVTVPCVGEFISRLGAS